MGTEDSAKNRSLLALKNQRLRDRSTDTYVCSNRMMRGGNWRSIRQTQRALTKHEGSSRIRLRIQRCLLQLDQSEFDAALSARSSIHVRSNETRRFIDLGHIASDDIASNLESHHCAVVIPSALNISVEHAIKNVDLVIVGNEAIDPTTCGVKKSANSKSSYSTVWLPQKRHKVQTYGPSVPRPDFATASKVDSHQITP